MKDAKLVALVLLASVVAPVFHSANAAERMIDLSDVALIIDRDRDDDRCANDSPCEQYPRVVKAFMGEFFVKPEISVQLSKNCAKWLSVGYEKVEGKSHATLYCDPEGNEGKRFAFAKSTRTSSDGPVLYYFFEYAPSVKLVPQAGAQKGYLLQIEGDT